MTVFKEMHEQREVSSRADYLDLKRMLSQAIDRGFVEQIAVLKPSRFHPDQEWYREKETGEIFYLVPPGERGGWWDRLDLDDLLKRDEKIQ